MKKRLEMLVLNHLPVQNSRHKQKGEKNNWTKDVYLYFKST